MIDWKCTKNERPTDKQCGYLDVLKRRVPLYRLNDLGREVIAAAAD